MAVLRLAEVVLMLGAVAQEPSLARVLGHRPAAAGGRLKEC